MLHLLPPKHLSTQDKPEARIRQHSHASIWSLQRQCVSTAMWVVHPAVASSTCTLYHSNSRSCVPRSALSSNVLWFAKGCRMVCRLLWSAVLSLLMHVQGGRAVLHCDRMTFATLTLVRAASSVADKSCSSTTAAAVVTSTLTCQKTA